MNKIEDLTARTEQFFFEHWVQERHGDPPQWKAWDPFLQGSVPNHEFAGCYALFKNSELVYVGLGASRGGGIYKEHGISRRLMEHVICKDWSRTGDWAKLQDKWASSGIDAIYTIGFTPALSYLSAALETYLIRKLVPTPPENRRV